MGDGDGTGDGDGMGEARGEAEAHGDWEQGVYYARRHGGGGPQKKAQIACNTLSAGEDKIFLQFRQGKLSDHIFWPKKAKKQQKIDRFSVSGEKLGQKEAFSLLKILPAQIKIAGEIICQNRNRKLQKKECFCSSGSARYGLKMPHQRQEIH